MPGTREILNNVASCHRLLLSFPGCSQLEFEALWFVYCRHWRMCLKNPHLLEWLCLHQLSGRFRLPVPRWTLVLWWLPPRRRAEAQWAGVDPERRQVFRVFLQGEADGLWWKLYCSMLVLPLCAPHASFWLGTHRTERPLVFKRTSLF